MNGHCMGFFHQLVQKFGRLVHQLTVKTNTNCTAQLLHLQSCPGGHSQSALLSKAMPCTTRTQLEKLVGSIDEPLEVLPLKRIASGEEVQCVFLGFPGIYKSASLVLCFSTKNHAIRFRMDAKSYSNRPFSFFSSSLWNSNHCLFNKDRLCITL